jgi:hypothetical protein
METITRQKAVTLIRESGGKLFGVEFIKRSNGALRRMTARLGVRKGVSGIGSLIVPSDHGLITVCEFVSDRETASNSRPGLLPAAVCIGTQFRFIPIEGIRKLRIGGKSYQVQD